MLPLLRPLLVHGERPRYIEPFAGGGSVLAAVADAFATVEAGDAHPDLVYMWNAVLRGWEPPEHVSFERYNELRHGEPSPERGYAGFACSFGGKWFGGYARKSDGTPDQASSRASLLRKAAAIRPHLSALRLMSFEQYQAGPDSIVYCDPPYVTSADYATATWRPYDFWDRAREWVGAGALVVVSEFQAPRDFVEAAATSRTVAVQRTSDRRQKVTERVFVHESQRGLLPPAGPEGSLW